MEFLDTYCNFICHLFWPIVLTMVFGGTLVISAALVYGFIEALRGKI